MPGLEEGEAQSGAAAISGRLVPVDTAASTTPRTEAGKATVVMRAT